MTTKNLPAKKPVDVLKNIVNSDSVQKRLKDALEENAGIFTMSVIDLYASDTYLQKCDPNLVMGECMKAASLKLPITKSLGFAYVVPFKDKAGNHIPNFIIGYKGLLQLSMRTGMFKFLNVDAIYDGETVDINRLTGEMKIVGVPKSDKEIGYFAFMELTNGFQKAIFMTKEQVIAHAKKYSKSYNNKFSAWTTDFGKMARKTPLRQLLDKWAPKSIDFIGSDRDKLEGEPESTEPETIDITPDPAKKTTKKKADKPEVSKTETADPGPTEPDGEDPY
jgi:recombination protein RecT